MGDLGSIPGLGRPPGGEYGNPLQYSCLENLHGQSSLAGGPWGRKESDMTEQLSTHRQSVAQTQHPGRQQPSVGTPSVRPPPAAQFSYELKVGGKKRGRIPPTGGVAQVQ